MSGIPATGRGDCLQVLGRITFTIDLTVKVKLAIVSCYAASCCSYYSSADACV